MVFQAALMAIIVLDGIAFIAFCTSVRKTPQERRQKDVRWALRIARVHGRARRHLRRHDRRLAGRRRDRGVLLGNAAL